MTEHRGQHSARKRTGETPRLDAEVDAAIDAAIRAGKIKLARNHKGQRVATALEVELRQLAATKGLEVLEARIGQLPMIGFALGRGPQLQGIGDPTEAIARDPERRRRARHAAHRDDRGDPSLPYSPNTMLAWATGAIDAAPEVLESVADDLEPVDDNLIGETVTAVDRQPDRDVGVAFDNVGDRLIALDRTEQLEVALLGLQLDDIDAALRLLERESDLSRRVRAVLGISLAEFRAGWRYLSDTATARSHKRKLAKLLADDQAAAADAARVDTEVHELVGRLQALVVDRHGISDEHGRALKRIRDRVAPLDTATGEALRISTELATSPGIHAAALERQAAEVGRVFLARVRHAPCDHEPGNECDSAVRLTGGQLADLALEHHPELARDRGRFWSWFADGEHRFDRRKLARRLVGDATAGTKKLNARGGLPRDRR